MRMRFHENIRFCPKCGVEALERDFYRQAEPRPNGGGDKGVRQVPNGTEWLCKLCGFGCRISKSSRHCLSEEMLAKERRARNDVTFDTECLGEEVAKAYVAAKERGEF